ncbi:hypothetical protein [Actinacidiphila glaucinigra]
MLLTWIDEVAHEPLVLEPADRRVEVEVNTWWLSAAEEDGGSLSVAEVVAAFERTAAAIRERLHERAFAGVATFSVWHDEQAGQLRCSTGSVSPDALPFGGAYVASGHLAPIVGRFLADSERSRLAWSDPDDVPGLSGRAEPEVAPLAVWVSGVGASK